MNNVTTEKHFDYIAKDYDDFKHAHNFYFNALKKNVIRLVPRNARVLDIGCGTGTILDALEVKLGVGIDISNQMILSARSKYWYRKTLKFYKHDIQKSPVNGAFDYILCTDVIEHFTNLQSALINISKTMNNKTILILTMANPVWEPFLLLLEMLRLKMPEGLHLRISEKEILQLLFKSRLSVIDKKTYVPKLSLPLLESAGLLYIYQIKKMILY